MSDLTSQEIDRLVTHAKATLNLAFTPDIDEEHLYHNLPLCVVDAVYSINAKYQSTQNVVKRFIEQSKFPFLISEGGEEPTISQLLAFYDELGAEGMANEVFQNRQRTSTKNGILKAEAVQRFAQALAANGIQQRKDVATADLHALKSAIIEIPGQRSGISLRYFFMLVGDYTHVKPDRMIMRFVYTALGRNVDVPVCATAISTLADLLEGQYPHLTPRTLDVRIWHYQRAQS